MPLRCPLRRTRWEALLLCHGPTYNVYRGDLAGLRAGGGPTCLYPGLDRTDLIDVRLDPPRGTSWFYVVTGGNHAGEGVMGYDTLGAARANPTPCP